MLEAKSAQGVGLLNQKKEIKTTFNVDFLVNNFCVCLFPCYCLLGTLSCWPFALMWVWNPERSCQPGSISKSVQNEMLMLTSQSVYANDLLMWNNFYWMCINMEVHSKGWHVFSVKLLLSLVHVMSNLITSSTTTAVHAELIEQTKILLCFPSCCGLSHEILWMKQDKLFGWE